MAKLFYFGRLIDISGTAQENVPLPAHVEDTETLVSWLEDQRGWQGVLSERHIRIVVNDEIRSGRVSISNGDEIGFLPPVGGG
ncbi:MAG: MoaD/ThiS family protein [Hyphomonas sp.]|uniref:MoaD/ThiS family protein n=1 Tax=Hyphomonas sp. TaxID=87 RepID=UPI0030031731